MEETFVILFCSILRKVPVPIGPLLALAMRILRVDGSRLPTPPTMGAAVSSVHQVSLCLEIPALHLNALDLLTAVLRGVRRYIIFDSSPPSRSCSICISITCVQFKEAFRRYFSGICATKGTNSEGPDLWSFFGMCSQLLPHGGDVVRLVSDYFRRSGAVAPVLRIKLYDFARQLFLALGAGRIIRTARSDA
jgi:hypothetical protein